MIQDSPIGGSSLLYCARRTAALAATISSLVMVVAPAIAPASEPDPGLDQVLEHVATVRGLLEIRMKHEAPEYRFRVALDGKTLFDSGVNLLSIAATVPTDEAAQLVLVEDSGGGSACPAMFRVVDLGKRGTPVVTKEFGNCDSSVTVSGDAKRWVIRVGAGPGQEWVFMEGRLRGPRPASSKAQTGRFVR